MNHLYKSVFAGISLLWLLAACSSDELATKVVTQNGQAIRFATNIGSETKEASRAVGQTWADKDQVGIFMINEDYTTIHAANALYLTQSQGSKVALASADGHELYFPQTGEVRFIGYYPYRDDITTIEDAYPITLGNQSDTAPFDLLWYKDTSNSGLFNKDIGNPSIDFNHQLSKIVINLYLDNGMEGHTIQSANLANIPTTAMFNLQTGAISDHANKGDVDFITSTLTTADTEAGIIQRFEAIIIPHTGDETEFTSRILTFGVTDPVGETMTLPWEIQDDKTFETNKLYTYNFTLTQTAVDFMGVTINDWSTTEINEDLVSDNLRLSEYERFLFRREPYTGTFGIKCNFSDTPMAISSDGSWLTVKFVEPLSEGKYDLVYECTNNDTGEIRTATITVKAGGMEAVYTITQSIIATVASANSIVLVTNGTSVCIPVAIANEPATYPGIADGSDGAYIKPFGDENNVAFEAKVLWIDSPNFSDASLQTTTPTDIIAGVWEECATLNDSYLVVTPGSHPGNAVVCITKPGTNDIIWSWHIWVTTPEDRAIIWVKDSYENKIEKPALTGNGYAFFPINLGAFQKEAGTEDGHPICGIFYQWGRKDPFPINHTQPTLIGSLLSELPYVSNVSEIIWGASSIGLESIAEPHEIKNGAWKGTIDLDGVNNNSWGYSATYGYTDKSPFDPCPAGWRVPPGKNPGAEPGVPDAWIETKKDFDAIYFDPTYNEETGIDRFDESLIWSYGAYGFFFEGYGGFYPLLGYYTECWSASPSYEYDPYAQAMAVIPNMYEYHRWDIGRSDLVRVRCVAE